MCQSTHIVVGQILYVLVRLSFFRRSSDMDRHSILMPSLLSPMRNTSKSSAISICGAFSIYIPLVTVEDGAKLRRRIESVSSHFHPLGRGTVLHNSSVSVPTRWNKRLCWDQWGGQLYTIQSRMSEFSGP